MSENTNQEPPRLGRRTNQGSRRVVRATGAKDSQVTEVEAANPAVASAQGMQQESQSAQDMQKEEPQSAQQFEERATAPEKSPRKRQYKRSEAQVKIADELFVDKGIEVSREDDPQTSQASQTAQESQISEKLQDAADTAQSAPAESTLGQEKIEIELPARRRRARVSRDDARSRAEKLERLDKSVSLIRRKDNDTENSADNADNNADSAQDSSESRSRRARAAVSQMLEFSSLDSSREQARVEDFSSRSNPMMSLLFQAPVIPDRVSRAQDAKEDEREISGNTHHERANTRSEERSARRRRDKRKTNNDDMMDSISHVLDETERSHQDSEDNDNRETSDVQDFRNSRRNRRLSNSHRHDNESDDARDELHDEFEELQSRSRRNRRLNAQERRAAAEVEQIESDLEYDDIAYEPIESDGSVVEENSEDYRHSSHDDEHESTTRTRRRRRSSESILSEDEEEENFTTRRRRRRRGNKNSDEDASSNSPVDSEAPVRSRKQQYIDEITDIEGSTRLEAKRQRRRDNRRDRNRQASLITEQDFLARREVVNRIMVVRERGAHTQVSVIEDDVLVEHYISDIEEVSAVGNIYQGRVQNVLPSMEAAFVDIGQARNGVLYAGEVNWDTTRLEGQPRRMEHAFKSGDPVLVQVTKDPIGHKGARLTSQVTLAGRFLVLVPSGSMTGVSRKLPERERARLKSIVAKVTPDEMGVIIRTAAEGASEEAIIKDLEHLKHQWEHISQQLEEYKNSKKPHLLQGEPDVVIRVIRDIFNDDFKQLIVEGESAYKRIREYIESAAPDLLDRVEQWDPEEHRGKDVFDRWQIDSQLRKGMERQVYLPSGGSLVIDRTEAMTTIDVNTGRFIGKGKSLEETVTRCNLEAAEEVVRQLRLRDIGGMVMIDFVDMVMPANRDLVLRRLVECLSRDRTKHQVAEVTSLGLVQMTRKRVGQGLVEAFSEECPTCGGRGFILHDEPTVNSHADDPYAMKGGDPFVKTNKRGYNVHSAAKSHTESTHEELPSTTEEVKNSMAAIAAAGATGSAGESQSKNKNDAKRERNANDAENTGDSPLGEVK